MPNIFGVVRDKKFLFVDRCVVRFLTLFYYKHSISMNNKNMTSNNVHLVTNQKKPDNFNSPSEIYLCVLGNGSVSSSRALYMFTDYARYLFNCGEGTQRIAHEHKLKLSKLNNIFITHNSWENLGGLLGLSLTVHDIGGPEINLHGPKNVDLLHEHASSFLSTKGKLIVPNDMSKGFIDTCIEVQYIPIKETVSVPMNAGSVLDQDKYPSSKRLKLSEESCSNVVISYACKGHRKPGHLLFEKCVEYGVPSGPLLGKLKNGHDITLPSGKIVLSKDVVTEEQKCPVFLVVECPSVNFLHPFVNEEKFLEYQTSFDGQSNIAALVIHFTPPHVFKLQQYQEWIGRFPSSTCHLVLNSANASLCSAAVHRIQHKLNLLHPTVFTLLNEVEAQPDEKAPKNIIQVKTLGKFYLRPFRGFQEMDSLKIESSSYVQEAYAVQEFEKSLKQLKAQFDTESIANKTQFLGSEPTQVIFLGTGSAIPSKVRNVSGILMKLSNNKWIILDCGEGTYNQLLRLCGMQQANDVLRHLCFIFVSHMHADHHLGLIQLLKSRNAVLRENSTDQPLVIIGPKKLIKWLRNYDRSFEPILKNYRFIECYSLKYNSKNLSAEDQTILNECCQNIDVSTVPVNHCFDAHGVCLTHALEKWKVVYSGDTTPSEALITAGKDCTLLVHEATMEDDLGDEAALKKHSTTSEAIKVAEKMNAKYTILTHFSQRYAKVPLFNENFHNRIGCAFDNMTVNLHELHILPLLIPTLKSLFAEDMQELQDRGNKRRVKRNILKSFIESAVQKNN